MFGKRKIAALVAEFLGTGVLTLIILTVHYSQIGLPFFVSIAAGLAVVVLTFAFMSVSGAHLNPAITIGLFTARKIAITRALLYVVMQLLGAYVAYLLYTYFVKNKLQLIGTKFTGQLFAAETVGTAIFAFGVAAALYQRFTLAVAASVTGMAYMLGIVAASSASVGLINPAVALGTRAWLANTGLLTWVGGAYVLGPILGAIIGINLYAQLFADSDKVVATEAVAVKGKSASTNEKTIAKPKAKRAPRKK